MLSKATFNWERLFWEYLCWFNTYSNLFHLLVLFLFFPPECLYILVLLCQLQDKLGNICAIISKLNVKETLWMQLCGLFMKHTGTIRTLELSVEEIFIATFQVQAYLFKSALEVLAFKSLHATSSKSAAKVKILSFRDQEKRWYNLVSEKKKKKVARLRLLWLQQTNLIIAKQTMTFEQEHTAHLSADD